MADAWHDMTDMERAAATELMGGKRNSNVISAPVSYTHLDVYKRQQLKRIL